MSEPLLLRYMQPLLAGRRAECFQLIHRSIGSGDGEQARKLITDVVWPAMTQIDRLYREDVINHAVRNMACRINRTVADQLQMHLAKQQRNGKRILIACADGENEESGAQMIADLLEADGWEVFYVGGGVPHDEIIAVIGQLRPAILVVFGTQPQDVPATRRLVEWIREVNTCPTMNILVSGGVFNRADGLWHEVGADVFCENAQELLEIAGTLEPREPGVKRTGGVKKRHRKRKTHADGAVKAASDSGTAETNTAEPELEEATA